MDKKPLIGIVMSLLLMTNISVVLGYSAEKVNMIKMNVSNSSKLSQNLAPNPSFEEGDTMPIGWTYSPNTTGIYTWDSSFAYTGEKSVGVFNLTNTYPYEVMWITSEYIPVDTAVNSYRFSAWFKCVEIPTFQYALIRILEYDSNYHQTGYSGMGLGYHDTEWHQITDTTSYDYGQTKYVKLGLGQTFQPPSEPNPLIEIRFDDVNFSFWDRFPDAPTITGKIHGRIGTVYDYTITTTDPDQDTVSYMISWGDNTSQSTSAYESGEEIVLQHTWDIAGTYLIHVIAIDEHNAYSGWTSLAVKMPCSFNIPFQSFWEKIFDRYPNAFSILRNLLGFNQ